MAYVSFGPHAGKLVAIVDVIDQNRVSGGNITTSHGSGWYAIQDGNGPSGPLR